MVDLGLLVFLIALATKTQFLRPGPENCCLQKGLVTQFLALLTWKAVGCSSRGQCLEVCASSNVLANNS